MEPSKSSDGVVSPPDAQAIDRESNTNRAYREIRHRILVGEMAPGDQYLEQELAEILAMSRTPVREALIRLADERLVEVRPRHGARILPVSTTDIREIYEMLAELESLAIRRVATHGATPMQLAAARDAQMKMVAALKVGDRVAWFEADRAFHESLVAACGNERLVHIVKCLTDQAHWSRQRTIGQYHIGERSDREHVDIINAVTRQDAEAAARLVRHHRMQGGAAMEHLLMPAGAKV